MKTADKTRFLLRLDSTLYRKLMRKANQEKQSINHLCSEWIAKGIEDAGFGESVLIQKVRAVYEAHGLVGVILFGSKARGDSTESSDTDLLFIFDSGIKINRQLYKVWEDDSYSIHCVVMPEEKVEVGSFWLEIALDGKILWERENKLSYFMKRVKKEMSSGDFIRKVTHGQPYWVKQK